MGGQEIFAYQLDFLLCLNDFRKYWENNLKTVRFRHLLIPSSQYKT